MLDISFILVSWNVRELLKRALEAILADAAAANCVAEIIVVDNASRDGTVEMLRADFPHVHVIANTENVGFTRGNNQGLTATASGQYGTNAVSFPSPATAAASGRYIFLLNPDTELLPGALRALLDYMDAPENARVGIVGPQLVYADGSLQSSRRRFPKFSTALFESTKLEQWFPNNSLITDYRLRPNSVREMTDDSTTQDVDWVVGAAMFVRRAVYEQIGGFDERFFMYSEELDWCYRAKQAGWRVVYFPNARVLHHEGKSSEQVIAQRDIYFHSSKVRYFKKHHGVLQGELLRWFLLGMFGFQMLEEAAKYVLGHKRELRAARMKAYRQVLASGLK
ncbi:MAG: glycosyltransferase family 2 protein [Chloroflexi bacterium]|nr:glycosyltransferase family 2 protein [Chloroflexota bacterium]